MGVQLGEILPKKNIELKQLTGRKIAIDAYNSLYQFLSIIRQPDGTPLMDSKNRVTSHLTGLLYRTAKLVENGVKPCYVFDGRPPEIKAATIRERIKIRKQAKEKWEQAKKKGDLVEAKKYAQQALHLTKQMVESSKKLLEAMGVPYVEAPGEGEAQAAFMCEQGQVWASASQDFDSLLFGSPIFIRNMTVTGRRKVPRKNIYVEVEPELIELKEVLKELRINREQLVEIGILCGTDYNEGIKGIGPKKALSAVQEGKSVFQLYEEHEIESEVDLRELKKIFLEPDITKNYTLKWKPPNRDKMLALLVQEHDFSTERVEKVFNNLSEKAQEKQTQSRLDKWG